MLRKLLGQDKIQLEKHPIFTPLINSIEDHVQRADGYYQYYNARLPLKDCKAYETLKNLTGNDKVEAIQYLIKRINFFETIYYHNNGRKSHFLECNLLDALIRTRIDFPKDFSFKALFDDLYPPLNIYLAERPFGSLVSQIEKHIKKQGLNEQLKKDIQAILDEPAVAECIGVIRKGYYEADLSKAAKKLQNLLYSENEKGEKVIPPYQLGTGRFGLIIKADLSAMLQEEQNQWNALFHHLATASAGKPSNKFLTTANKLIDAIGESSFKALAVKWFDAAAHLTIIQQTHTYTYNGNEGFYYSYEYIENYSFNLLKGLLWAMSRFRDKDSLKTIAYLTEKCFQKIPGVGPAAAGIGNAGIYTLATSEGLEGISHLSRLKLRIKQNNTQKLIQNYLEEQAKKRGIKAAQIEEIAVSDYGLLNGERIEKFEDYQLAMRLTDVGVCELQWLKPDGKPQKTTPAFVSQNEELAAQLKQIKDLAKQAKQASSIQRDRIDRLYLENLTWQFKDFSAYYLNHGLMSIIARKLIWVLDGQPALFVDDQWQNEKGEAVPIHEATLIKLWHPIDSKADTVLAWRERLETLQIKQPFKQAYREIYLLTDAEINTRVYSNRMAAHILKQHQFNSLAAIRGWKYSLLGAYDDGRDNEIAQKPLPEYGLIAQFWIDEILDDNDSFNEAGIWNYVATDQVRFCNAEGNEAIPLIEIPPLVFSEIMRDVDLFVGVASVGNDPQWQDGGPQRLQNYRDYWQSYSFGDLTEVAKVRKSVLERLLPRLKIRDVAKIDGKFLIVQGKRHDYKIHIGSGNILIAPNDRYLCIVPSRGKDKNVDGLFLPFEGDNGLSIVLSKAFLLAADDKITDPTILSQL